MRAGVAVHGLEIKHGETVFAFLVLRFARPAHRTEIVEVIRHIAGMIPDAEGFISELPEGVDVTMHLVGMPWAPPSYQALEAQQAMIQSTAAYGVEAAWFFQAGTSLSPTGGETDEGESENESESESASADEPAAAEEQSPEALEAIELLKRAGITDDKLEDLFGEVTDPHTPRLELEDVQRRDEEDEDEDDEDEDEDDEDEDEDDEDDDDDATWSHGPPPQVTKLPFPVDGYPAILEELDWEDFGISFKLAGAFRPGESTVLLGFHALWLSPYGGRYRNAAVTVDRTHNSAHLWVDRFAVPCSAEEQVGHLLWVLSQLHEVSPILHARFCGATMAEKYGNLVGDTSEPFVLGGNPLLAIHATGGEAGVDAWLAEQTDWSEDELAQMLRELAVEIVTSVSAEDQSEDDDDDAELSGHDDDDYDDSGEDEDEDDEDDDDDDDESSAGEDEDDEEEDEDDEDDDDADHDNGDDEDDEDEDNEDDDDDGDRGRHITAHAGALLTERARAGLLDPRAADALRPLLATGEKYEHRRTAIVGVLGALRDRASVPALIRILEDNPIKNALDSVGKEELLARTAAALGAIADPAAIPALASLVTSRGRYHDRPRSAAADALASCLAAAPEPRDIDDAVIAALLDTIHERDDGELNAEMHFAYGRLAQQLPAHRRDDIRRRLVETEPARRDTTAQLARHAALALASGEAGGDPRYTSSAVPLRPLMHAGLTELDYDHDDTLRNLRVALRVAEAMPQLVEPADLIWLTRFSEPDLRDRAHALLDRLHHGMPRAHCFDPLNARDLDDDELVERVGDPHVVGRAALVGEIARRDLTSGRAAVLAAVQDVVNRARPGDANLLDPDARLLEVAIPWLRGGALDREVIVLFDRILRHANPHVKWELLQEPPDDERLLGGMFHVLAERWGWQERTAREWLRQFEGSDAFEAARKQAGSLELHPEDHGDDEDLDDDADDDIDDDDDAADNDAADNDNDVVDADDAAADNDDDDNDDDNDDDDQMN